MPEINRVPFQYEPMNGGLYLGSFRRNFYMERIDDIRDTLQHLTVRENNVVRIIEGELFFTDDGETPPSIRDVRYAHPDDRREHGEPFSWSEYTLPEE